MKNVGFANASLSFPEAYGLFNLHIIYSYSLVNTLDISCTDSFASLTFPLLFDINACLKYTFTLSCRKITFFLIHKLGGNFKYSILEIN